MTTAEATKPERLRPRIVQTEERGRVDLVLAPPPETEVSPVARRRRRSPVAVAMGGLALLLLAVIAVDFASFIDSAFAHGRGIGIAAIVAVTAGAGGVLYWLWWELRGLLRLRSAERLRLLIPSALSDELKQELDQAAVILAHDPLLAVAVTRYRGVLEPSHTGADALDLFSRFVLVPADRLGQAAVRRAAAQAFAINAVSPTMLTDTVLFAARAIRLIREIAEIYGQRPGVAGTWHLLWRLVGDAGLVGAVDVVGGVLVQQLGGAVLERLGANAAESAYAAQKMARLGLVAMALCRPVAFSAGEAPSLASVVAGLLRPSAENKRGS